MSRSRSDMQPGLQSAPKLDLLRVTLQRSPVRSPSGRPSDLKGGFGASPGRARLTRAWSRRPMSARLARRHSYRTGRPHRDAISCRGRMPLAPTTLVRSLSIAMPSSRPFSVSDPRVPVLEGVSRRGVTWARRPTQIRVHRATTIAARQVVVGSATCRSSPGLGLHFHSYRNPIHAPRGAPSPRNGSATWLAGSKVRVGLGKTLEPRIPKFA